MTINNNLLEKVKGRLVKALCINNNKKNNNVNIYFENFTRENLLFIALGKMILAKGIQNKTNGNVISINRKCDRHYDNLCKALLFKTEIYEKECRLYEVELAKIYTYLISIFCNSKEKILNIRFRGIYIGDLIYNSIIRFCNTGYSINKIIAENEKEIVKNAFLYVMVCERIFRKQKPTYYIFEEIGYTDGVILRVAYKYGAKLINYFADMNCCFVESGGEKREPNYHSYWYKNLEKYRKNGLPNNFSKEIEKCLQDLFGGEGNLNATAKRVYSGKLLQNKEDIKKALGIHNRKKNVIILAHCFSDCPISSKNAVYADYYEWLEETLKIVSKLDNVNWIIRPHPMRYSYNEGTVVESLYEKYNSNNLYWMSDEYNAYMIPVLADAIITVTGTAGIEYSCLGIPCINTGTPFYSHYGFTINVKNVEQYKKVLCRVHRIRKLSERQILRAKEVMFMFMRIFRVSDDSFQMLSKKAAQQYEKDKNRLNSNNDYLQDVYEWLENNNIEESYLYQFGYTLGENELLRIN